MDEKERSMQEMLNELEAHIQTLESEETSLEDSFKIYEKGMTLVKLCNDRIDLVEKKVLELDGSGTLQEME